MNKFVWPPLSEKAMPPALVRFYSVGLVLYMLPFTRAFFITLIPFSLLLVVGLLFYFHSQWNAPTLLFFLFIGAASFGLEMAGTATGEIFGAYQYERGLGIQFRRTPLIIGLNWILLVYASRSLAEGISARPLVRILVASLLMVAYDVVLEWVAPAMQMWRFDTGYPPMRNFVAWLLASLVFQTLYEYLPVGSPTPLAGTVWKIQVVFFLGIGLYTLFFIR